MSTNTIRYRDQPQPRPEETFTHVPNAPLRAEFERQEVAFGLSRNRLANAIGIDPTYLARKLGMQSVIGDANRYYSEMRYELAVCIAQALGMSPHEAGV